MSFDLNVDFFPESLLDIYPYCFINLARLFNNERRNTHFVKWKNEQLPSHEISTFSEQLLNNTSLEGIYFPSSNPIYSSSSFLKTHTHTHKQTNKHLKNVQIHPNRFQLQPPQLLGRQMQPRSSLQHPTHHLSLLPSGYCSQEQCLRRVQGE